MIAPERHSTIERFIGETMNCFTRMTGAERLALYICDAGMTIDFFERRGLPDAFHRQYLDDMYRLDPFDENLADLPDVDVALLSDHLAHDGAGAEYRRFLESFQIANMVEMVFRTGNVLAGMSVCLPQACDRSTTESICKAAHAFHPYILFNLSVLFKDGKIGSRDDIIARYGLSKREAQVAELICKGFSNGDLARALHVSVATVKTHLLNIFAKTSVTNRTSLVSLLMNQ
ncbi:helix-turn-helix transcriptional regulator [Burkholderia pseudomultivorans]|uniref:helix-turn-helix transcriptional regulator n=1 Tax=Burkholderia pseudomultivorans TaxID=1207504 RepID=UPI000A859427|nr:helix-turn-helix transcriptional regulator [Burkholderia pseudomultivorans]MDS0790974.1 helix-turn-helix transcriptional regulator [Burkholderia pseudomultivorans]